MPSKYATTFANKNLTITPQKNPIPDLTFLEFWESDAPFGENCGVRLLIDLVDTSEWCCCVGLWTSDSTNGERKCTC